MTEVVQSCAISQSSLWGFAEICRNLNNEERFVLGTTCKAFWYHVQPYMTIKMNGKIKNDNITKNIIKPYRSVFINDLCSVKLLEYLSNCYCLEDLTIINTAEIVYNGDTSYTKILDNINNLENLRSIKLILPCDIVYTTEDDMVSLCKYKDMEYLENISLSFRYKEKIEFGKFKQYKESKTLKSLKLKSNGNLIFDNDVQQLSELHESETITELKIVIKNSYTTNESLEYISELYKSNSIEKLCINIEHTEKSHSPGVASLHKFKDMVNLTELTLYLFHHVINDEEAIALGQLGQAPKLKKLQLDLG